MSPTIRRPLVLILVLLVLIAVRLVMEQTVRQSIHQFGIEHGLIAQPPEPWKTPTRAEYVARAYSDLEDRMGRSTFYTNGLERWLHSAYVVALYGDPEKATKSIIDRIENCEDRKAEDFKWPKGKSERFITQNVNDSNRSSYRARLNLLAPLGLTRTERAEEFLLDAYKNPFAVNTLKKYKEFYEKQTGLVSQEDIFITSYLTPSYLEIILSLRISESALLGLLYLNEEKYSPMVEAEYNKLLSDSKIAGADAEAMYKNEYYRLFPEASRLDSKDISNEFFFMERYLRYRLEEHRDALDFRDTIREIGAEKAVIKMYDTKIAYMRNMC